MICRRQTLRKRVTVVVVLAVLGCACQPDRGRCLKSRERDASYTEFIPVGSVQVPIYHKATQTVCDQWEFPNGKP